MKFTKMHGCGNDYIYVNAFCEKVGDPAGQAVRLSDRHKGIGADGLILICPSETADCRMEMYNADGSRGKMCGNGIRCVAKFAGDHGIVRGDTVVVETDSGLKTIRLRRENGSITGATVDMGPAVFWPNPLQGIYDLTCLSMGNPHAVLFVDDVAGAPLDTRGKLLSVHQAFPEGVNVGFACPAGENALDLRVWERGSGETLACGTGACAAAAAAHSKGLCGPHVEVRLPGGTLGIEITEQTIFMTGDAVTVFTGEV